MSEKVDWGPIWTSFMDKESYFIDWKLACYHSYVKITLFTSRKILGPPPPHSLNIFLPSYFASIYNKLRKYKYWTAHKTQYFLGRHVLIAYAMRLFLIFKRYLDKYVNGVEANDN